MEDKQVLGSPPLVTFVRLTDRIAYRVQCTHGVHNAVVNELFLVMYIRPTANKVKCE